MGTQSLDDILAPRENNQGGRHISPSSSSSSSSSFSSVTIMDSNGVSRILIVSCVFFSDFFMTFTFIIFSSVGQHPMLFLYYKLLRLMCLTVQRGCDTLLGYTTVQWNFWSNFYTVNSWAAPMLFLGIQLYPTLWQVIKRRLIKWQL